MPNQKAGLLVDSQATIETRNLFINLIELADEGLMFGHQDDLAYGIGWWAEDGRSDIKEVCGSYPAVYGWEIGEIELGHVENLDGVNFELLKSWIKIAYERGGINTISWHSTNPVSGGNAWDTSPAIEHVLPGGPRHDVFKTRLDRLAAFLESLKSSEGEYIPIIFRPYHEHTGGWFWWGVNSCTREEYIQFWQFTVEYLRDVKGLHHLLYAYSPSTIGTAERYLDRYPGDDFVDVLGLDDYNQFSSGNTTQGLRMLRIVTELAQNRDKVAALTELGLNLNHSQCWTNFLNPVKNDQQAKKIAWFLVWRNANINHMFAPYPGHPTAPDFINFYNDPFSLFEDDLPDMYSLNSPDSLPPDFIQTPDDDFTSFDPTVQLQFTTDERAYLKYSYNDQSFDAMPFNFENGQGSFQHSTAITGEHGANYTVYVRARDLFGNSTENSVMISFSIDTTKSAVKWNHIKYDDSHWQRGPTPIGFGEHNDVCTQIPCSRTVYLRKEFTIENVDSTAYYSFIVKADNGAVVYLNENEIGRFNMMLSDVDYLSWANNETERNEAIVLNGDDLSLLNSGKNTLAVEVHQHPDDSTDMIFNLRLINPEPVIELGADWCYYSQGQAPPVQIQDKTSPVVKKETASNPAKFRLYQNYPNPFNMNTSIRYELLHRSPVRLEIYDLLGQKITTLIQTTQPAGIHSVEWDGKNDQGVTLGSGIYLCQIESDNFCDFKKMLLIK